MTPAGRESPYVGLTAYAEGDAEFFFGRAREIDLVIANLQASRLTLLYGESGVGKSSILRAGVMRALHEEVARNLARLQAVEPDEDDDEPPEKPRIAVALFRGTWVDPPVPALMATIHRAVEEAAGERVAPWSPGDDIVDTFRRWTEHVRTILVVLDQFEEYFLYHPDDEGPDTLAGALPAAVNDANLRVNFLLSIREDALAKLDRFKKHVPIFGNVLRINYMDERAARDAIERPLERWTELTGNGDGAYAAEPELVAEIIRQVRTARTQASAAAGVASEGANGGIETPVLQLVLTRLWDEECGAGSRVLRLETFQERLRGAESIVRTQLDRTMAALSEAERDAAAESFRYLVTPSGSKFAQSVSDLAGLTDVAPRELDAVLEKLAAARILRPVPPPPGREQDGARYEIFHDVLGEPILEWRRELELAREREAEARRRRALRRRFALTAAGLLALVVAFAAFAAWALHERGVAADRADVAESQALAARSIRAQSLDPRQSLVLAAQAAAVSPTPQADEALRQALVAWPKPTVLVPPGRTVYGVDFSSDGRLVATAGEGGARVASTAGRVAANLLADKTATSARFSADGRFVVVATADGAVRVWRVDGWRELPSFARVRPYRLARAALTEDGRFLVAGGYPGWTNRVWRFADGRVGPELTERGDVGGWIEPDGTARVVDAATAASATRIARGAPLSFTSNRSGSIAAASAPVDVEEVVVRRTATGAVRARLQGWSPVFSPGGSRIAAEGDLGEISIWDLEGFREAILTGGSPFTDGTFSFSPDGRFVVRADGYEETARIWDRATGALLAEVPPRPPRFDADVSLNTPYPPPRRGGFGAVGPGAVAVRDPAFAFVLAPAARLSGDGLLATWGRNAGGAQLWVPFGVRRLERLRASSRPDDDRLLLPTAVSPDGGLVAVARRGGEIDVRSTRDGRLRSRLRGNMTFVSRVAFSHGSDLVAASSFDGAVRIWQARTGRLTHTLRGHRTRVGDVAFSPDGTLVASAGEDGTARIWRLPGGERVRVLREPRGTVTSVAFSGDGDTLVTGGGGGATRVWSTESWEQRAVLRAPGARALVLQAPVSRNGRFVATLDLRATARIWRSDGGQPIRTLRNVSSVAFSPDGAHVVAADGKATARILRAADGVEIGLLRGHTNTVNDARFNARGDLIATAAADGHVRVWLAATNGAVAELAPSASAALQAMLTADGRLVVVGEDGVTLYACEPCLEPARLRALAKERLAPARSRG